MGARWRRWLLSVAIMAVAAGLALACASDPGSVISTLTPATDLTRLMIEPDVDPELTTDLQDQQDRFRVVLIADTHIIGPNYDCCESNNRDTQSIYRTEDRLRKTRDQINRIRPRPDFVILLGDVFHDGYLKDAPEDVEYYLGQDTAMGRAADLLKGFEMPVYPLWGNHDYSVPRVSREFSQQIFKAFFDRDPYYSFDHKGWRFILANSQLGPTWDPNDPLYDKGRASYGRKQLRWIDRQLSGGLPSVVFFHYPLLKIVTQYNEAPWSRFKDLPSVLADHKETVKLTLSGHMHHWLHFSDRFDVPHMIIGATRYDQDNFWLIEFDSQQGTYEILDKQKANWARKTAERWNYQGDPEPIWGSKDLED